MAEAQKITEGQYEGCYEMNDTVFIFDPTKEEKDYCDSSSKKLQDSCDSSSNSESEEKNSEQAGLDMVSEDSQNEDKVIVPSEELESDNPECEFCGEEMEEADNALDDDYLCMNDGCEGVKEEEEDDKIIFEGKNA